MFRPNEDDRRSGSSLRPFAETTNRGFLSLNLDIGGGSTLTAPVQPINEDDPRIVSAFRAFSDTTPQDFLSLSSLNWTIGEGSTPTAPVQRNESVVSNFRTAASHPPPPYKCEHCPASFDGRFQFYGHLSVHSEKRKRRKLSTQDLKLSPPNANSLQGIHLNKLPPPST